MKIPYKKSVVASAVAIDGAAISPLVMAQAGAGSKAPSRMLEEVVVPAQTRAQDSLDVPLSISALT